MQMYEAKKVADWTNKMAKIEEASRKKDELNNEFMVQAKETLINKMEHSEEKREAIITEMKEKLKVGDDLKSNQVFKEGDSNDSEVLYTS